VPVSLTHVAARQELRAIMTAAGLGDVAERKKAVAEPAVTAG
jgi:hypothetical protein